MEYNKSTIKDGVHRFMEGDTSLEEEAGLRTFFRYSEAPAGLEDIAAYFSLIDEHDAANGLDDSFDKGLMEKIQPKKAGRLVWLSPKKWLSVAAVVIAVFSIYYLSQPEEPQPMAQEVQSQEEIRQAFEQAKAALLLVGGGLEKGRIHAASINQFNEAQEKIKKK